MVENVPKVTCAVCKGTGKITTGHGASQEARESTCSVCRGTGKVVGENVKGQ